MSITRRTALQALAAAGATAVLPGRLGGRDRKAPAPDAVAVLYDGTRCIGCRECVLGCAEANGCDGELATLENPSLSPLSLSVLRRYEVGERSTFRKIQCMHCVDPACASACMLGAMHRDADGAVVWNADLCVGCRYCEIACPFNIPRFEWDTPTPALRKCELCPERRAQGLPPACVEQCRRGALTYGGREELLAEAHRRIDERPDLYNSKVYGEHDGGGTSFLYLTERGVSFASLGLPELGTESVPSLPETIQHTLYKGFLAPLALFGLFGILVRRNTRAAEAEGNHVHHHSEPVGGKLLTWPFLALLAVCLVGVAAVVWRFTAGLGATTNLNDGYAMGLWIAFDVVTGTALACGGYAVAILVYLANRGKYHPLVRAAIVTSALGYTLGGLSVLIDIGRAWNFYKIPLYFWDWNLNSILLEVALCIMLYTGVLWIEVSPAFLERWRESRVEGLRKLALVVSPRLERAMPYLIAFGLLLPTMHQSSLGSLMLIAGQKLHPLWHTPLLPALFLVSCVAMGYAAVVLESLISSRVFNRPREIPMLRALAGPVAFVLLTFAALRMVDVTAHDELGLIARMDGYSLLFLAEMALFVVPAVALLLRKRSAKAPLLATVGVAVIVAGTLYRFSTYLFAFNPGPEWSYFPALPEFAVTFGIIAAEAMGYLVLVKRFPILRGVSGDEAGSGRSERKEREGGDGRRAPRPRLAPTGAAGVVVALSLLPAVLPAQQTGQVDLRCLASNRPELCLEDPVPADEPHGAVCATCHDVWAQATPSEAARSCIGGGCHANPRSVTAFHRSVHAETLEDCTGCHRPHDARIPGGGENCSFCHVAGGRLPAAASAPSAGEAERAVRVETVLFRHSLHRERECTACHASADDHRTLRVSDIADCRSCHHSPMRASDCLGCHAGDDDRVVTREVEWTFDIRLGSLDRPRRVLSFDHGFHAEVSCRTCHTGGPALTPEGAECGSCHEDHHRPTANCRTCHAAPADGAHDVDAHLGCAGTGCHERAPAAVQAALRERELCLACHRDRSEHKPASTCSDCHLLPPPRESAAAAGPHPPG